MYSFLYLSFSMNIVFSYVDLSSTIMYIVFVDFNKSSFQKKIPKKIRPILRHIRDTSMYNSYNNSYSKNKQKYGRTVRNAKTFVFHLYKILCHQVHI